MSRRRPGNGSATLLDMLSNLFYFSLFLARERGVTGKEETKRERERTRERKRKREGEGRRGIGEAKHILLLPLYLLPSAHVDAIFQYRVKRALPLSFHPPTLVHPLFPPFFFLSFRLAPSLLSRGERENGSEARNEKKGRKESAGGR